VTLRSTELENEEKEMDNKIPKALTYHIENRIRVPNFDL
jgi:hypothetical protein